MEFGLLLKGCSLEEKKYVGILYIVPVGRMVVLRGIENTEKSTMSYFR